MSQYYGLLSIKTFGITYLPLLSIRFSMILYFKPSHKAMSTPLASDLPCGNMIDPFPHPNCLVHNPSILFTL